MQSIADYCHKILLKYHLATRGDFYNNIVHTCIQRQLLEFLPSVLIQMMILQM